MMMLKLINLKLSHYNTIEGTDSSQIENYESLVDLFTLLSFVLIISTFLFGFQRVAENTTIQTMSKFRNVYKGNAPPVGLPENTLVLIQTAKNNQDIIYLVESGKSPEIIYSSGQKKSLWSCLEEKKQLFMDSNDIQVIINNKVNKVNGDLFLIITNWFAQYSLKTTTNFSNNVKKI